VGVSREVGPETREEKTGFKSQITKTLQVESEKKQRRPPEHAKYKGLGRGRFGAGAEMIEI
jgi:hypothetical protein